MRYYKACFYVGAMREGMSTRYKTRMNAALTEALAIVDEEILDAYASNGKTIPFLYDVRPRYYLRKEERWCDIDMVVRDMKGDCKDFTAWRLAELRRQGIMCRAESVSQQFGDFTLYHVYIRYPDGSTEDPARILGMP